MSSSSIDSNFSFQNVNSLNSGSLGLGVFGEPVPGWDDGYLVIKVVDKIVD